MRIYPIILLAIVLLLAMPHALAENGITVLKPYASAGSYGTGEGQIDAPLSVKVDADDNIYVLQMNTNGARNKSVITIYKKNLTFLRSFDVIKTTMSDQGWNRAWSNFYYDDLASDFYIGSDGLIYILCGWDVVVMDNQGKFQHQFPVNAFMGSISSNANGEMQFYFPHGLVVTDDGYVVTTSGSSPNKHEIIFIYPDGKLFTKVETPVTDIYGIARDGAGNLYVIGAGSNVVHTYDRTMTKESDLTLNFNGYSSNPASMAFFSNGNFSASANGIFIFNNNGSVRDHIADNAQIAENKNWGRPITVNSEDSLIVVSGAKDAGKTPKPIMVYRYDTGRIVGADEPLNVSLNLAGVLVLALLAVVWLIGALFILKDLPK